MFVSKRLRELEEFHCQDPSVAPNLEAHRVMQGWSRLLAEIVTTAHDDALEKRLRELEQTEKTRHTSPAPAHRTAGGPNTGAEVQ